MNSLRISTLTLSPSTVILSLIIVAALTIAPNRITYAHHINKNAPPGPIKKSTAKKKAVKKSIDKTASKTKAVIVKKVENKSAGEKSNTEKNKNITTKTSINKPNKPNEIKTVKPIVAKPAVIKPSKLEPDLATPQFELKNKPEIATTKNPENSSLNSKTNKKDNAFIENKKTQGALIGGIALGAATASPVGLVLGGLGGYMVGKGEQADIEYQEREAEKQRAIKPAPPQANYQICNKMAKNRNRRNLPFCFYSME